MTGGAVRGAIAALLLMVPTWDANLLSSGAYKYAADVRDRSRSRDRAQGRSAALLPGGAAGTVSVRQLAGTLALAIDGKVDASNRTDMLTQKLLAHLPLLLHADPGEVVHHRARQRRHARRRASPSDIERADVIEISPEVVDASSFFANENGRALDDRAHALIVGDGRSHLLLSSRRYDVIISEPSNPWMAGVASLFTREFFDGGARPARARRHHLPMGPHLRHRRRRPALDCRDVCQRVPERHDVAGRRRRRAVRGDERGPRPALENIARAWRSAGVAADLAKASVFDPFGLLSLYVGGPTEIARYGQGAPIQTDDHPLLEFSARSASTIGRQREPAHRCRRCSIRRTRPWRCARRSPQPAPSNGGTARRCRWARTTTSRRSTTSPGRCNSTPTTSRR